MFDLNLFYRYVRKCIKQFVSYKRAFKLKIFGNKLISELFV